MRTFCVTLCGLLIVGLLAGPASAALVAGDIQYAGSFKINQTLNPNLMAFVPDGNARPSADASGEGAVVGPSLLVTQYHSAYPVREFVIPTTLYSTPAALVASTPVNEVPAASAGTYFKTYGGGYVRSPNWVDSAGNIWCKGYYQAGGYEGMQSNPLPGGTCTLGTNTTETTSTLYTRETGWGYASYGKSGIMRLWDGAGNDLPTDGMAVDATFVTIDGHTNSPMNFFQNVRQDATTMTSTLLFKANRSAGYGGQYSYNSKASVAYMKVWDADVAQNVEYFLINEFKGHYDSGSGQQTPYYVDFFDGTLSDGGTYNPNVSVDIGALIAAGAGWNADDSRLYGLTADWVGGKFYIIESKGSGTGTHDVVHVFSFPVPEPATMGLLGLGFAGLAALRRRRKR